MIRKEKLEELHTYMEEMNTIEKIPIKTSKKSFLTVKSYSCLLKKGSLFTRDEVLKNGKKGNASIVLPITKDNNTLFVVQPRVFTETTVGIEFPSGYIEDNETPKDAALRELQEETGYIPKELIEVNSYYQDQGCSGAYNHSFIALNCEKKYDQRLDNDEHIRYFECKYQEAFDLAELGYIRDANSLLLLEKSKTLLKRR